MATRAHNKIQNALIQGFKPGGAIAENMRVKFAAADDVVLQCAAGEDGIGVAITGAAGAGNDNISVCLDGHAIVPVKVGTGGATRGSYADCAVDGLKDRAIADGATPRFFAGKFMQTGVVGDLVGLMIGIPTPMSTA